MLLIGLQTHRLLCVRHTGALCHDPAWPQLISPSSLFREYPKKNVEAQKSKGFTTHSNALSSGNNTMNIDNSPTDQMFVNAKYQVLPELEEGWAPLDPVRLSLIWVYTGRLTATMLATVDCTPCKGTRGHSSFSRLSSRTSSKYIHSSPASRHRIITLFLSSTTSRAMWGSPSPCRGNCSIKRSPPAAQNHEPSTCTPVS